MQAIVCCCPGSAYFLPAHCGQEACGVRLMKAELLHEL